MQYVARLDDPGEIDPLFVAAIAARIALRLCRPLTQSESLEEMRRLFADRLRDARSADAQEGGATGSARSFRRCPPLTSRKRISGSGELSPRLLGRPDIEQFGNGAQLLENFTVLPQGGITRRPGTFSWRRRRTARAAPG